MARTRLTSTNSNGHGSAGSGAAVRRFKGKWLPGTNTEADKAYANSQKVEDFRCDCCDVSFAIEGDLQAHLKSKGAAKDESKSSPTKVGTVSVSTLWTKSPPFSESTQVTQVSKRPYQFDVLGDSAEIPVHRAKRSTTLTKTCGATTSGSDELISERVQCPTCFATFDVRMMGKHLLSFFHCQQSAIVGRSGNDEEKLLLNNIQKIVELAPFQCRPCKFYFNRHEQLLCHFKSVHAEGLVGAAKKPAVDLGWDCSACRSKGISNGDMLEHLKNSSQHKKMQAAIGMSIPIVLSTVQLFKCSVCPKKFTLRRAQASHLKVWHPDYVDSKSRLRSCETEDQKKQTGRHPLGSVKDAENNEFMPNSTKGNDMKKYQCMSCEYSTDRKSHYGGHLQTHDVERPRNFECDICNGKFYSRSQLNFHAKTHSDKTLQCTFDGCTHTARVPSELVQHSVIHNATKAFNCDQCQFQCNTQWNLSRHIRSVHQEDDQVLKCSECSFVAKNTSALKKHALRHVADRPYTCPFCDYNSKSLDNLRTHVIWRTFHKGKQLYNCSLCDQSRSFATNTFREFRSHVRSSHPDHAATDEDLLTIANIRKTVV